MIFSKSFLGELPQAAEAAVRTDRPGRRPRSEAQEGFKCPNRRFQACGEKKNNPAESLPPHGIAVFFFQGLRCSETRLLRLKFEVKKMLLFFILGATLTALYCQKGAPSEKNYECSR